MCLAFHSQLTRVLGVKSVTEDETIRLTKDLDLDMKARGAAANPGAVIELLRPEELKPLENPVVELIVPRSAPSSSGWVFSSPIKIEAEHALIEAIVLPDLCSFAPGDPPCATAELTGNVRVQLELIELKLNHVNHGDRTSSD
jgi:hypothetical protein